MIRFDLIESVRFHKLRDRSDRRGPIATLVYGDIPNEEYAERETVRLVQRIVPMLSNHYSEHAHRVDGIFLGEQNECWIDYSIDSPRTIIVRHKYWSDRQVTAFTTILRTLADLHGWKMED